MLESGIAATHLNWLGVAPELAKFARVRAYDRAGFGYSPPLPGPRTARQCAAEIPLDEPAIVVAHSFGCLIARALAETRPELVRALVLLDPILTADWYPPTRESESRRRYGIRVARTLAVAARLGLVRLGISLMTAQRRRLSAPAQQLLGEIEKLPPETWPTVREHWSRPQSFESMRRYLEALPVSCEEGADFAPLGDIPLTVISGAHWSPEQRVEHLRWAALSTNSRYLIARQGLHWVHLDDPELVIEEVRRHC
ncbi:MAG: alpha/beta fold hydrolase [Bryobacteraceae bacterium]|nr:alpha/beta fold hydrolase [Bryobacteraceae bacterium]